MAILSLADASLYYREAGSGEPLVLIHGTGVSSDIWEKVVFPLSTEFRVIVYDRRGHQRSPGNRPDRKQHYATHAEDLRGLLEHLKVSRATVLGWGAGGFVALHAATRFADKIDQVILYEAPWHARSDVTWPTFKAAALIRIGQAIGRPEFGAEQFRRLAMAYCYGDNTFDDLSSRLQESILKDTHAILHEVAAGTGEELASHEIARVVPDVRLMCGQHSPDFFAASTKRLRNVLPKAPVFTIIGGNHFAHVDCPAAFVKCLHDASGRSSSRTRLPMQRAEHG